MSTKDFKVQKKSLKYENPWMRVYELDITRDGSPGIYGLIERQNTSVIIASTRDDRILFVRQYRFPIGQFSWELPMGGQTNNETPLDTAERELTEETGLEIPLRELGTFRPVPGLTSQLVTVFTGTIPDADIETAEQFSGNADDIVDRRFASQHEIAEMVDAGEIVDGFTLTSLTIARLRTRP